MVASIVADAPRFLSTFKTYGSAQAIVIASEELDVRDVSCM